MQLVLCDTFDTSISIESINVSIPVLIRSRYIVVPRTTKYRDMTIPVSIPCNRSIVDNCILRDSNESRTSSSHQNHSCRAKLVICSQFAHVLINVLSTWHISSSLWCFVNLRDLTAVRLMGWARNAHVACTMDLHLPLMTQFCLHCLSCAVLFTN